MRRRQNAALAYATARDDEFARTVAEFRLTIIEAALLRRARRLAYPQHTPPFGYRPTPRLVAAQAAAPVVTGPPQALPIRRPIKAMVAVAALTILFAVFGFAACDSSPGSSSPGPGQAGFSRR
jgi:hypothetical protein